MCYVFYAYCKSGNINRALTQQSLEEAQKAVEDGQAKAVTMMDQLSEVEQDMLKAMALRFPLPRNLSNGFIYDSLYTEAMEQVRERKREECCTMPDCDLASLLSCTNKQMPAAREGSLR